MAGLGNRFAKEGYIVPKPFIQINGQYMLDQSLRCLPETDDIIFGSLSKYMSLLPLQDYGNVVWLDETPPGQ